MANNENTRAPAPGEAVIGCRQGGDCDDMAWCRTNAKCQRERAPAERCPKCGSSSPITCEQYGCPVDPHAALASAPASAPLAWHPMSEPPPKPGRYPVAHRGGIGGDAYWNAPDKPGWSQFPDLKPTHWTHPPGRECLAAAPVADERAKLRAALEMAVRQNEHDMLLTGEELRQCRAALSGGSPEPGEAA